MKPDHAPDDVHWIIVADASRAQIFGAGLMLDDLVPREARVHPDSRLPARDIVSDDRGATREGVTGTKSRFERHTDPHQSAIDVFARELAEVAHAARVAGAFERLVLVAPPHFLGALRSHLDRETARTVVVAIAHEWTTLPSGELASRIRAALPGTVPAH